MKVKQLIEELGQYHPDMRVVVSRDEEGNGFNVLHEVDPAYFIEVEETVIGLDDEEGIADKKEAYGELEKVLILWP